MTLPECPKCHENYTYEDGTTFVCPMCFHEWTQHSMDAAQEAAQILDAHGNVINEGDEAVIIKDLKLGNSRIKQGAKITNIIKLDQEVNGHNLQGHVEGHGILYLKTEVIKKTSK
ncbi:MAG: zinc ribbon domain-containing protein YjdM [Tissierellia bacterium]|nr:zinc ribbon domain-containing protein YjdM [Tissierellia bacterium]